MQLLGFHAQAIEEVARACRLPYLLLCSTDDPDVKATWTALGFLFTTEEVRASHLSHPALLMSIGSRPASHANPCPRLLWAHSRVLPECPCLLQSPAVGWSVALL